MRNDAGEKSELLYKEEVIERARLEKPRRAWTLSLPTLVPPESQACQPI